LLVGQPPFHSEAVSETLQRICTAEPVRPRQLNRRVPRDLETICLKCLEKSPARRYGSAHELVADLRRFLVGEPVLARPVSRLERSRRWFVRNPVVGSLSVVTALALIAGTVFSTYYALQSREREREAIANLYAADMNLAQQHVRAGAVASAIRLLEKHLPPSASRERQQPENLENMPWEWRHLWHQCHGELRRFEGPQGAVYSVAFSPDGRTVAAAGADKTLWLWETATGNVIHKLRAHTATIRDLMFTPDGKRIVTVGDDCLGIIWDATTGERITTFHGHEHPLTSVAISPDCRFIATGGTSEPNVKIWSARSAKLLQSLELGPTESLAFAPTRTQLTIAGIDGFFRVCQLGEGGLCSTPIAIRAHTNSIRDLTWSPEGARLATAGADYVVKLWDTKSWREVDAIRSFKEQIYSIGFSPDGRRLVIAARNTPVKVWDFEQRQVVNEILGHTELITCTRYCPDGWRLISASEDGTVRLWDAAHTADHDRLEGHVGIVRAVAFSPDGKVLASCGAEGDSIILWNPKTGSPIRKIHCATGVACDLAFSPDGRCLASAYDDGYLRIWDVGIGSKSLKFLYYRLVILLELLTHRTGGTLRFERIGIASAFSMRATVGSWQSITLASRRTPFTAPSNSTITDNFS
jgi:WD40 repeat protein